MGKFEDALEFLKSNETNGNDLAEAVLDRIHKANAGEKGLRDRVKKAEAAQEKFNSISEVLEGNGIDLDGDLQEQIDTVLKKSKVADTSSVEMRKMAKQLEALQKQVADASAENERLIQVGNRAKIKDKLSSAFREKILNAEIALDYRINNGDILLTEDGEVAFKNGDELITENIVDAYAAAYKTEVRNTQKPGGGSNPGGGSPKTPVSIDAINKMSPQEYASLSDEQRADIQTKISTGD